MATNEAGKLIKLSDTDETVATGDEDIRGYSVKDRNGDDIGKVDDLLIDEGEQKVRLLEIGSGGFLGIGKDKVFIPVDAITGIVADDDGGKGEVRIDQTREHVAGAPVYDPEIVEETAYYGDVSGYYGYGPFWAAGYTYPGYPYYR